MMFLNQYFPLQNMMLSVPARFQHTLNTIILKGLYALFQGTLHAKMIILFAVKLQNNAVMFKIKSE